MGILKSQSHFEIGSDVEEVIVSEYGRHLEGEYVRSRLRVKALDMTEASVDAPAGAAGESGVSITNMEGSGGFEPFVDERGDRVAILGSLRTSLGLGYTHMEFDGVASSGCDKDSWADASAPTPSWTGATESGQRGGDQGILGSLRVDEASALVDTMLIDLIRRVDCDVDSTSSAEAHAQGDPPRIGDTVQQLAPAGHFRVHMASCLSPITRTQVAQQCYTWQPLKPHFTMAGPLCGTRVPESSWSGGGAHVMRR